MRQLRQKVQAEPRVGNLRICASGTEIVVRDESGPWRTPTGQYLLEFEVSVNEGTVRILDRSEEKTPPAPDFGDIGSRLERGLALELTDANAAIIAYQECLIVDPENVAARINCGRLLHEAQRMSEAEAVYGPKRADFEDDPDLLFNLALLFEDTHREQEAIELYQRALQLAPDFPDAHFNLARLYQELHMPRAAIRHWNCYRRLTAETP